LELRVNLIIGIWNEMATRAGIIRAKRLAIGGKRKRCKIGKSCSAACVNRNKFCLVDMPAPVEGALSRAVKAVRTRKERLSPAEKRKSLEKRREYVKEKLTQGSQEKNARYMYFKYDRQLKGLEKQGLKESAEAKTIKEKRDSFLTSSLKAELKAEAIVKNDKEWRSLSKSDKIDLVEERLKSMKVNGLNTPLQVESYLKGLENWVRESPDMNNKTFRSAILAARYLRGKIRREEVNIAKLEESNLRKMIEESPKYNKTPGSSMPMGKVDPDKYRGLLESKIKELKAKEGELTEREEGLLSSLRTRLRSLDWGVYKSPSLSEIYDMQGYNAKPEIVFSRKDLENRKDLIQGDDGKALMLWRGVSNLEYSNQFKGIGPDGGIHFQGEGLYGNGTYAASVSPGSPHKSTPYVTAKSYSGTSDKFQERITVFGIRNDANVVMFDGDDKLIRSRRYNMWASDIIAEARSKLGYEFHDVGEAAAAMGIHAYRVPQTFEEDYWVVLNRGALVVAMDPQIDSL